ncbi:MAG: hypothetical protein WB689_12380 [Xanthobacteraceae bacterium]
MPARRFPPPWSVEETSACFVLRDANGEVLAYVYCEEAAAKLLTKDEARRIAVNIAKLPSLASRVQVHNDQLAREQIHIVLPANTGQQPVAVV